MIMEQVTQAVISVIGIIITGVGSYIGIKVKAFYQAKVNTQLRKTVVDDAVKFAQQVFADLSGEKKFKEVKIRALNELTARGIPIHPDQLDTMIESSVWEIKNRVTA